MQRETCLGLEGIGAFMEPRCFLDCFKNRVKHFPNMIFQPYVWVSQNYEDNPSRNNFKLGHK